MEAVHIFLNVYDRFVKKRTMLQYTENILKQSNSYQGSSKTGLRTFLKKVEYELSQLNLQFPTIHVQKFPCKNMNLERITIIIF